MGNLTEDEMEKLREMIASWGSAQVGISAFKMLGDIIKWLATGAILWVAIHNGSTHP